MTGNAVTLRRATLRFGQHVIWENHRGGRRAGLRGRADRAAVRRAAAAAADRPGLGRTAAAAAGRRAAAVPRPVLPASGHRAAGRLPPRARAFTGAVADNPIAGALAGSLIVGALVATLGSPAHANATPRSAPSSPSGWASASCCSASTRASPLPRPTSCSATSSASPAASRPPGRPLLRDRRQRHRQTRQVLSAEGYMRAAYPGSGDTSTVSATPPGGGATASNLRPDRGPARTRVRRSRGCS